MNTNKKITYNNNKPEKGETIPMKTNKPVATILIILGILLLPLIQSFAREEAVITTIRGSQNIDPLHPPVLTIDDQTDTYTGYAATGGETGWIELTLEQPMTIYGLKIQAEIPADIFITVEYEKNDVYYPLISSFRNEQLFGEQTFDLSYDSVVTDSLRLTCTGGQLYNVKLYEVAVLGTLPGTRQIKIKPDHMKADFKNSRFFSEQNLVDNLPGTFWMTWKDENIKGINWSLYNMTDDFYTQEEPSDNKDNVTFLFETPGPLDSIYLYITTKAQGMADVMINLPGGQMLKETLDLASERGWYRIQVPSTLTQIDSVTIELYGNPDAYGGIGEVEFIREEPYSGDTYLEIGPCLRPGEELRGNYTFAVETPEKNELYILETAVLENQANSDTVKINGKEKIAEEQINFSGYKVYRYFLTADELMQGENYLSSITPTGEANLTYARLRKSRDDGYAAPLGNGLGDGKLIEPASHFGEMIYEFDETYYIENVVVHGDDNFDANLAWWDGEDWWNLTLENTNSHLKTYTGSFITRKMKVTTTTGLISEVRLNRRLTEDKWPGIKIIYPEYSYQEESLCNLMNKDFICIVDAADAVVTINGLPALSQGTIFRVKMKDLLGNLKTGLFTCAVTAIDAESRQTDACIDILINKYNYEFIVDQGTDDIIYTDQDSLTLSGSYQHPQGILFINDQEVDASECEPLKWCFSHDVSLEVGLNLVDFVVKHVNTGRILTAARVRIVRSVYELSLTVTDPGNLDFINKETIIVTGHVMGTGELTVLVNGNPCSVEGTRFISPAIPLTEGENIIIVTATDQYNGNMEKTITVFRDTLAPVITAVTPQDGKWFTTPNVTVSGTVDELNDYYVYINNTPAHVEGNVFYLTMNCMEGENQLTITAADKSGNYSMEYDLNINLDTTPPEPFELVIDPLGWTNKNGEIQVYANATDLLSGIASYETRIDGGAYTPFVSPLPNLSDGEHTIVVKATDLAGNYREAVGSVFIDTTPPAPPQSFRAISGNGKILLRWERTADDIESYVLIRLPGWEEGVVHKIIPATHEYSVDYTDDQGITGEAAYVYILVMKDHAGNDSEAVLSDIKFTGIEIVDTEDYPEDKQFLVEYGNSALVMEPGLFPENLNVKKVVCTEIDKQIGKDNNGDGVIDEYVDSPLVERAVQPIVGPIYNYSLIVEHEGKEVAMNHMVFNKDFLGRIRYNEEDIPAWAREENLDVYYFNEVWCKWMKIEKSAVDVENNQIVFATNHFSGFTVQPTIMEDLKPEDLRNSGYSPFKSTVIHSGVTISPEGGGAHMEVTEFDLPGKNGFDLSLKRVYDSTLARYDSCGLSIAASIGINFFSPNDSIKEVTELAVDFKDITNTLTGIGLTAVKDLISRFARLIIDQGDYAYSMGQGWRLNLPFIRSANGGVFIRHPNGGFYDITEMEIQDETDYFFWRELELENHSSEDFRVKVEQTRLPGVDDVLNLVFDINSITSAWEAIGGILDHIAEIEGIQNVPVALNLDVERLNELKAYDIASLIGSAGDIAQAVGNLIPDWSVSKAELILKDGTKYEFGAEGMLEKIESPTREEEITISYRLGFNLTDGITGLEIDTIEDSMGRILEFEYESRPEFLFCNRSYINHIELKNDPYARMVDYTIDISDGLYGDNVFDDAINEILGITAFGYSLFPISLLTKSINSANRKLESTEKIENIYRYLYDPKFLTEFGGSAKLNLFSTIGDIISMAICGVPLVSAVTGWDNLTLTADVRFDIVFPIKEINGPGIGRILLNNEIEVINYGIITLTDFFLGIPFLPLSIEGKLRHIPRLVVNRVDTYKDITEENPEQSVSYTYDFDVTQRENIYNHKTIVNNGRLITVYKYSTYEYERDKMITWSDAVVENLRNRCLLEPVYRIRIYNTSIRKIADNTLLEEILFDWSSDKNHIIKQTTQQANDQYLEVTYDYDNWGNIIHTSEITRSGEQHSQLESWNYYYKPNATSQSWGNNDAYDNLGELKTTPGNPYQTDHNTLTMDIKRYNLMLGTIVRNYLPELPEEHTPDDILMSEYINSITYNNYDTLGRNTATAQRSDSRNDWIETEITYDIAEGYANKITRNPGTDEEHTVNIEENRTGTTYDIITTTQHITTPDGQDQQLIQTETGLEKATGWKAWEKDARGHYTTYFTDGFGRPIKIQQPSDEDPINPLTNGLDRDNHNPETEIEYNETKWTTHTDFYTGFTTTATITIDDERQTETTYDYNNLGQLINITKYNPDYTYGDAGNGKKEPTPTETQTLLETTLSYNGYGDIINITRPFTTGQNRTVNYQYDPLGKVKRIEYPDYEWDINRGITNRNYINLNYEYENNCLITTNEKGNTTRQYYNMKNKVIKTEHVTTVYTQGETHLGTLVKNYIYYDGAGNNIVQVDGRGNISIKEYNDLNQVIKEYSPLSGIEHGIVVKQQNTYNELFNIRPMVEYEYSLSGNKVKDKIGYHGIAENMKRTVAYKIDELGRILQTSMNFTPTVDLPNLSQATYETADWANTDWTTYDWTSVEWDDARPIETVKETVYYDENNNKIKVIDSENTKKKALGEDYISSEFIYSVRNKVVSEKTFVKRDGNTYTLIDPGTETTYTYDLADNILSMTNHFGYCVDYFYDNLNRIILGVKPKRNNQDEHPYTWFEYELNNQLKQMEQGPEGAFTTYTYNTKGLVLTETIQDNLTNPTQTYTMTNRYDAAGNQAEVEDAAGNITTTYYDELNRIYNVEKADGGNIWTRYDENGNQTYAAIGTYTDKQESWVYYDNFNRQIKNVDAMSNESELWYDLYGNTRKVQDVKDRIYYSDYDELNQLIREENPRNMVTYYGYDTNANMIFSEDPMGTKKRYFYDEKGFPVVNVLKNGDDIQWTGYNYDELGGLKDLMNSEGIVSKYNYTNDTYIPDPYGAITAIDQDIAGERDYYIGYEFDTADRLTNFNYPNGEELTYAYNRLGQITYDNNKAIFNYLNNAPTYNENGMMSDIQYVNGINVNFGYDNVNRLNSLTHTSTNFPEEDESLNNYNIEYNAFGNIWRRNTGQYSYDDLNRLTAAQVRGTFEVDVEEKVSEGRESQTAGIAEDDYRGEEALSFTGDTTDIVYLDYSAVSLGISLGSIKPVSRIRLYPEGDVTGLGKEHFAVFVSDDNNVNGYNYVSDERWVLNILETGVFEIRFKKPIEGAYIKVHCFADERDGENTATSYRSIFGNVRGEIMRIYYVVDWRFENYTYDETGNRHTSSNRLDGEEENEKEYKYYENSDLMLLNGIFAYSWDNNGNMIAKGDTFVADGDGKPVPDSEGEVQYMESSGEYWLYVYDLYNRLAEVRKSDAGKVAFEDMPIVAEYLYDGNNLRVKKVKYEGGSVSETKYFCFSNSGKLIMDESDTEYRQYIYFAGKLLASETGARVEDTGVVTYTKETTYFYLCDHLGSTTMITSETGEIIWSDTVSPFGESGGAIGIIDETILFTAKQYDGDINLYYFNARWYDASIGRFTTEDPARDGANWFVYCGNNPLVFVDPSGMWIENEDGSYTAQDDDTLYGLGEKLNRNWREFDYEGDKDSIQPGAVVRPKFDALGATINTLKNISTFFKSLANGSKSKEINNLSELERKINDFISQFPENEQEEMREILEGALMFTNTGDSLEFWQGEMTAERAAQWSYINNNNRYQCQAYFCDLMKRELGDDVYSIFYDGNNWSISGIWSNNDAAYRLDPNIFTEDMVQELGDMGFVLPFTSAGHIAYVGNSGMNLFSNPITATEPDPTKPYWESTAPQGGTISNYSNRDALLLIQAGTFAGAVPSLWSTNGWGNSSQTQFDTGIVNVYLIITE